MDSSTIAEWATELKQRLADLELPRLPNHVVYRVAVLLHPEELEFVESQVAQEMYDFNGRILIFTTNLLALVTLNGVRPPRAMTSEGWLGDVEVQVIRRKTLRRVVIPPATEEGQNYNAGWDMDPEELTWPSYGVVRLSYPDPAEDLVLGDAFHREADPSRLGELVPRLIADLAGD